MFLKSCARNTVVFIILTIGNSFETFLQFCGEKPFMLEMSVDSTLTCCLSFPF